MKAAHPGLVHFLDACTVRLTVRFNCEIQL